MDAAINFTLLTLLSLCAATDIRVNKIYNIFTIPFAVFAVAFHSIGNGADGFLLSTIGMAAGVGLLVVPYLMGGMAAGDVKLMGAVGSFLGAKSTVEAFFFVALAGGVYSLALIMLRRDIFKGFFSEKFMAFQGIALFMWRAPIRSESSGQKPRLKYGVAIALGTITHLLLKSFGIKLIA